MENVIFTTAGLVFIGWLKFLQTLLEEKEREKEIEFQMKLQELLELED